jgi:hypothetical protein
MHLSRQDHVILLKSLTVYRKLAQAKGDDSVLGNMITKEAEQI